MSNGPILTKLCFFGRGDDQLSLVELGDSCRRKKMKTAKMGTNGLIPGDFISIDAEFCADHEYAMSEGDRCPVFALLSKNSTNCNHFGTKSRILSIKTAFFKKLATFSLTPYHHVKERKKLHLGPLSHSSRMLGVIDLQGQKRCKIVENGPFWTFLKHQKMQYLNNYWAAAGETFGALVPTHAPSCPVSSAGQMFLAG